MRVRWSRRRTPPSSAQASGLRVVVMLKTAEGGRWIVPQVEELRRRGNDVVVVLPAGPGRLREKLHRAGVSMVDSPFGFRFRPAVSTVTQLWLLRRLLRRLRPDVVHYHHYHAALAARLSLLGLGMARIFMVPGPLFLESAPIRTAERFLTRLDDVVIAGSAHTADRYRSMGRRGDALGVVPYGVDTRLFRPADAAGRAAARRRLGIPADVFVAVMVAYVYAPKSMVHRGSGIKGHDVLLAAWRTFTRDFPRSRLILVGGGWDAAGEEHRQDLLRRFDVAADPAVDWFAGVIDVSQYYAAADVSVSPSLSENHGAALEAGASGVPCVVSDAGGLPETVTRDSGWVVPAGDVEALVTALRGARAEFGSGSLARRGSAAREHIVKQFDSGDCARAVADLVEAAGGRRATSRRRPAAAPVG